MRQRTITLKLTRRNDGMWCKKISGRLLYFGPCGCDEAMARKELLEYLRARELGAVRVPIPDLLLFQLADQYAASCDARVSDGSLQRRTWSAYDKAIASFVKVVGRESVIGSLGADSFAAVARAWRKTHAVNRVNNDVQAVRTMFKWAFENGLIDRTPIYGREFAKAPAFQARIEQREKWKEDSRCFTAAEISKLLARSRGQLRTMILLALNGGMYSVDVSDLKWEHIRKIGRVTMIDTTRFKTGIPRRTPLWPETVAALGKLDHRSDRIFVTAHGNEWNQRNGTDSIGLMFRRFRRLIGVDRPDIGFGSFRHTHVSAVGDHPDRSAARLVRAHQVEGIERHYDFPSVKRLKSVTDLARRRLLNTGLERSVVRERESSRRSKARGRAVSSAR